MQEKDSLFFSLDIPSKKEKEKRISSNWYVFSDCAVCFSLIWIHISFEKEMSLTKDKHFRLRGDSELATCMVASMNHWCEPELFLCG